VVARVHFRGHVNRHLRGLAHPGAEPLPRGAQLVDDEGRIVGDVRSAVVSPRLGGIALAMVRREVPLGAMLRVRPRVEASTTDVSPTAVQMPAGDSGADAGAAGAAGDTDAEPRVATVSTLPFPL